MEKRALMSLTVGDKIKIIDEVKTGVKRKRKTSSGLVTTAEEI